MILTVLSETIKEELTRLNSPKTKLRYDAADQGALLKLSLNYDIVLLLACFQIAANTQQSSKLIELENLVATNDESDLVCLDLPEQYDASSEAEFLALLHTELSNLSQNFNIGLIVVPFLQSKAVSSVLEGFSELLALPLIFENANTLQIGGRLIGNTERHDLTCNILEMNQHYGLPRLSDADGFRIKQYLVETDKQATQSDYLITARFLQFLRKIFQSLPKDENSTETSELIGAYLNDWLAQYVLDDEYSPAEIKAAFPLRSARVTLSRVTNAGVVTGQTLSLVTRVNYADVTLRIFIPQ